MVSAVRIQRNLVESLDRRMCLSADLDLNQLIQTGLVAGEITQEQASLLRSNQIRSRVMTAQLPMGITAKQIFNSFSTDIAVARRGGDDVPLTPAALTVVTEVEPNGTTAEAQSLSLGFDVGEDDEIDVTGTITSGDIDIFKVQLEAGDILGGAVTGTTRIAVLNSAGTELMGSQQNATNLYPDSSPLPKSGNAALGWVVDTAGTYYVRISGTAASYTTNLRLFRPTLEQEDVGTVQKLFIDFDGATVDATLFGGTGMRTLSPLSTFLAGWGLTAANESAVITAIMANLQENLSQDMRVLGNNGDYDTTNNPGDFDIILLNSRDHADPFGDPTVSRVIVGGTIAELGISTIGIAEDIDPGNFDWSSTAVTLLDLLSTVSTNANSLNQFSLAPGKTIIDMIGVGVGNVTAHEAGHFFGNWHTENGDAIPSIQDQGGNLTNTTGVGADRTLGTADDVDVDFGDDAFESAEGFTGTEDTLNVIAFGLSSGMIDPTTGDITGLVFNDLDGDGTRDAGEAGLSGVTVYLDLDNDSIADAGEPLNVTGGNGTYAINSVLPGSYVVRQIAKSGYTLTAPPAGFHSVTVTIGGIVSNADFGNKALPASISGTTWEDIDGDKVFDAGEPALPNVLVYLDANDNAIPDAGEVSVVSDSLGRYTFLNLAPGNYTVRQSLAVGFEQTFPTSANGRIEPDDYAAGTDLSTIVPGVTLSAPGATPSTVQSGIPLSNYTSTGVRGFINPATTYWVGTNYMRATFAGGTNTVSLDFITNDSSERDPEILAFNAAGVQIAQAIVAGVITGAGTITSLTVNAPAGQSISYIQAYWDRAGATDNGNLDNLRYGTTRQGGHVVTLDPGENETAKDFGIQRIAPGSISGATWSDADSDGVKDAGESVLSGWTVYLDANNNNAFDAGETNVVTDASGLYTFNVNPGTYKVSLVRQAGYVLTFPASGSTSVTVGNGQAVSNINFGNHQIVPGKISGTKWSDVDGDGIFDAGESPLAGITIFLDLDSDRILDVGEPNTVTNAAGEYSFLNVLPGTYVVREVVPLGYRQTFPSASGAGGIGGVAVFDNGSYVDTAGTSNSESDTVQQMLAQLGIARTTFTGISAAELTAALANASVLVIPELEINSLYPALTTAARLVLQDFVQRGGGIVSMGDASGYFTTLMNGLFGYSIGINGFGSAGATHARSAAAAGTVFADAPASLGENDATTRIVTSSLPASSLSLYSSGLNSIVASVPYGSGKFIMLGWDWYNAAPLGTIDNGWSQILQRAMTFVNAGDGAHRVTLVENGDAAGLNFGNQQIIPGSINGVIYSDADRDGTRDVGEAGLANWTLYLDTNANGTLDAGELSTLSNAQGEYRFDVNPGTYRVRFVQQAGYEITSPVAGFSSITVGNGQAVTGVTFGNHFIQPATLGGTVWSDLDRDGVKDVGEPALTGWTIFLDTDADGVLDVGEVNTTTDASGMYSFSVNPGTYRVTQVLQAGYERTFPTSGNFYTTAVVSMQQTLNLNFGDHQIQPATLGGTLWSDLDRDGVKDVGEPALEGWTLFLDADADGVLDVGEVSTTTNASGVYSFSVNPGTYRVTQVLQAGYQRTFPTAGNFYTTTVVSMQQTLNLNFGNHQILPGSISGTSWNDLDGDGVFDANESPFPGVTIYLDLDNDRTLDAGEPTVVTDGDGKYTFANLAMGTYTVREVVPAGYEQTSPRGSSDGLYIAENGNSRVREIGLDGIVRRTFTDTQLINPDMSSIAFGPDGVLYVSGYTGNRVVKFNAATGAVLGSISVGSGPTGIEFGPDGNLWVSNYNAGTVARYNPVTNTLVSVLSAGFSAALDIERGPDGNMYVVDRTSSIIQRFNGMTGALIGTFISGLSTPYAMTFGPDGAAYVTASNGVRRYNGVTGVFDRVFTVGGNGGTIYSMKFAANGDLYTVDASVVQRFNGVTGNYISSLVTGLQGSYGLGVFGSDSHIVTIDSGSVVIDRNFGNVEIRPATLSGTVFTDTDQDGIRDVGEAGRANQLVFLDSNGNGSLEGNETLTFTDVNGAYSFTVAKGSYSVVVARPAGTVQTLPAASAARIVTVTHGQVASNLDFGLYQLQSGVISGTVWADVNRNATRDAGEAGLTNWIVFLDADSDGSLDAGEAYTATAADGTFSFTVAPGTYRVAQLLRPGYERTVPVAAAFHTVIVASEQTVTGRDFGNHFIQPATLGGTLWSDLDRDGVKDVGEPALSGWTIFLDTDADGVMDVGEVNTTTDASGVYSFSVNPGTYRVTQVLQAGYERTFPTSGNFYTTAVVSMQQTLNLNFGDHQIQPATLGGTLWSDLDRDGVKDVGEPALEGWTLFLDADADGVLDVGEVSTTTNATGIYSFSVNPGTYRVTQVLQAGYQRTFPTAGNFYTTTVVSMQQTLNLNFGNHQILPGSISGTSWLDRDGDGVIDAGEGLLAGITVYVDLDNDRVIDAGEPTQVTDASGRYTFTNIMPGEYVVRQILPSGFEQTFPNPLGGPFGVGYIHSNIGEPWGTTTNVDHMNAVFGIGQWTSLFVETLTPASIFSPSYGFLYIDGSDQSFIEISAFMTANRTLIENWISLGGSLFINAAGNEGTTIPLPFGGTIDQTAADVPTGNVVNNAHPIFTGPLTPASGPFTGNSFSHSSIIGTGFTPLLTPDGLATSTPMLAERAHGGGWLIVGGMTTTNFHTPSTNSVNMRRNILSYAKSRIGFAGGANRVTLASGEVKDNVNFGSRDLVRVTASNFEFETRHAVTFDLNVDVAGSVANGDILFENVTTGGVFPVDQYTVTYDAATKRITIKPLAGTWADADYRMTLKAGSVSRADGTPMALAATREFFVLAGDVSGATGVRDRVVDFTDLLVLSQNFGTSGKTYSQGNLNYDAAGNVDFDDLLLLAQRYGARLGAFAPMMVRESVTKRTKGVAQEVLG